MNFVGEFLKKSGRLPVKQALIVSIQRTFHTKVLLLSFLFKHQ